MKKVIVFVLLLALTLSAVSALADGAAIETKMQYMPSISAVEGTDYLIVTEKFFKKKSVYNTEGQLLVEFPFTELEWDGFNYFTASNGDGVLNRRALVHISGSQITELAYDSFTVLNRHWVVGTVLAPATAEAHQLQRGEEYYNIDHHDFFYLENETAAATPVGSLTAEQYQSAGVHGDYIAIMDAANHITVYDKTMKAYDYEMADVNEPIYGIQDYAVFNLVTGKMLIDGFTDVREEDVAAGPWLSVTHYNFKGQQVTGLIDLDCKEILPVEYGVAAVTDDYVQIANENSLQGLYSLKEGKVIVPCEFGSVVPGEGSIDNYVHRGYVTIENGGMRGYYNVAEGKISCEAKYDAGTVQNVGCSMYWKVSDGVYKLVAADGVETEVQVDEMSPTRGDGYLLIAKRGDYYGVIDWHGNEILPFEHKNEIVITDDSKGVIRSSTGYQFDRLTAK